MQTNQNNFWEGKFKQRNDYKLIYNNSKNING